MKLFFTKKLFLILLLGFSSGLPLTLTASTMSAFLTQNQVSIASIGLFGLVTLPYVLKFLWSPLIDNMKLPLFGKLLGKRRGWLIFIQILLMPSIIALGMSSPEKSLYQIALLALIVAFLSATQDIIIDALRIELLKDDEQAAGASMTMLGARLGMLTSSAGALYIASFYDWKTAYLFMAAFINVGIIATILCNEPHHKERSVSKFKFSDWIIHSFITPFAEFIKRVNVIPVLLFIIFYKLSDAYVGSLTTRFLLDTKFSLIEIANAVKIFGLIATLSGTMFGAYLAKQFGLWRTLLAGCIIQICSNFAFIALAYYGHNVKLLFIVISIENFSSGVGTAALVAYLSLLCNKEFTASQYALLSAFASLGRVVVSSSAGYAAEALGWTIFFVFSSIMSAPCLILINYIKKTIKKV